MRLNVFVEHPHALRVDKLAVMKGTSKSAIIAAALAAYLSPDGADRREAAIAKRLEKLTHQFDRLERDQAILIESFALFVRHHFAITPLIPEAHQDAARAQSKARFDQFIEQLARHLQRGHSLVRDVFQEIAPPDKPRDVAVSSLDGHGTEVAL